MSNNKEEEKIKKLFESLFDSDELKLLETLKKSGSGK
jgi:hypothetical protein